MPSKPNVLLIQTDQQKAQSLGLYGDAFLRTPCLEELAAQGVLFEWAYCNYPLCVPSRCSMLTGRYPHTIGARANFIHLNPLEISLPQVLKEHGYQTVLVGKHHCFTSGGTHPHALNYFPHTPGRHDEEGLPYNHLDQVFDVRYACSHGDAPDIFHDDPEVLAASRFAMRPSLWHAPLGCAANPHAPEKCGSHLISEAAIRFLQQDWNPQKPFFMWLSFPDPHTPYQVPEPYASMFDWRDMPPPIRDRLDHKPERQRVAHVMDGLDKATDPLFQKVTAVYYGMSRYVDDSMGRVMAVLDEMGVRDRTFIMYVSDHGDFLGEHGMMQKQNCFYEDITRIPFLVSYPEGFPGGTTCPEFVELVDVMPTILDVCGIEIPWGVQGKSLVPLLRGEVLRLREYVVCESGQEGVPPRMEEIIHHRLQSPLDTNGFPWCAYREAWEGRGKMLRTRDWKLNIYDNGEGELYDMRRDPRELQNLFHQTDCQAIVHDLSNKLLLWCMHNEDVVPRNQTVRLQIRTGG